MNYLAILFLFILPISSLANLSTDDKLRLIINLNKLHPKDCSSNQYPSISSREVELGKLFFDTVLLSGDKDTSCKTCHLDNFGSTDGLPISVGVGGAGENIERYEDGRGILVQRNSFSLFGRAHVGFKNYFWDGKLDTNNNGRIISQLGDLISDTFEAPLSVASVLPLLERDEFLGRKTILHENKLQKAVGDKLYFQRYLAISKALRERINNDSDARELKEGLISIGINPKKIELAHIGNLIGKFISDKFRCQASPWDSYLMGNLGALSHDQKKGAILFFGKGRCSNCHSGELFSDFSFHSIAVPQGIFGPHSRHRDLGRAAVTLEQEDLFRFRTPPLLGVSKTAPYGHNGIFSTLNEIVVHHINPIEFFLTEDNAKYNTLPYGKILNTRDPILTSISITSDEEINQLLKFLHAL